MRPRMAYLDNLKILLVVGVIAMHTAITYGFDGSWYLESYDVMNGVVVDVLTVVLGTGWLFGLGLFFLIAGRLSAPSLERKGARRFAADRLVRLGIPVVAYTLLISPVLEYVEYRKGGGTDALLPYVREQVWSLAPGPTWFLEALLAFSLAYAAWRALRRDAKPPSREPLTGRQVAAVALAIAITSFTAHLAFPIGSEQFHLQLGMFPQYVILFSVGAAAGRRGWLETLSPRLVRRCGIAGALAAPALLGALVAGGFFDGDAAEDRFAGGWHWEAAAFPLAEGVLATCVSLWAIGFFRRRFNHLNRPARLMAPHAYGAYFLHPPVLVGLALAIQPLPAPAEAKFVAVLAAGVAASFGLAALVSRAGPIARVIASGPRPQPRAGDELDPARRSYLTRPIFLGAAPSADPQEARWPS
jgi:glucans biosynthesis protein C